MGSDDTSLLVLAGIAGLLVGSFLNVVIYRAPLGLSVSSPRSFCPNCQHQLSWWENVPVVSWALLRAQCRACHQPISFRYPMVELATGIAFSLVTWAWHGSLISAGYCFLAVGAIAVALIELGGERAPLSVAAIAAGAGEVVIVIGAGWHHDWKVLSGSLIGTVVAIGIFAILRSIDPDCLDPRAHGRSMLLLAGCWIGGLGPASTVVGVGFWIGSYFLCMVGAWSSSGRLDRSGQGPEAAPRIPPVFAVPLVPAILIALVASLIVGR